MARFFKIIQWLSLDVAAGAIFVMILFSTQIGGSYRWQGTVVLGLAVWSVYALDHLLDIRQGKALTPRRQFHHRFRKPLALGIVVCACAGLLMMPYLESDAVVYGALLAVLVALYLIVARSLRAWKEFVGGLFYGFGVALSPLAVHGWSWEWMLGFVGLFFIAWQNLLLFALFEHGADQQEGFTSFVSRFGAQTTKRLIGILTLAVLVVSALLLGVNMPWLGGFFLFCQGVHSVLLWCRWFHCHERYRVFGDWVFVMAGAFLL